MSGGETATELFILTVNDETNPLVNSLVPINNSRFNVTDSPIEISSNVTDGVAVDSVSYVITNSSGNVIQASTSLTQVVGTNQYNASLVITTYKKDTYTVTYTASDTAGNINNSETRNFIIDDSIPIIDSIDNQNLNTGATLSLTANCTDSNT